MQEGKTYDKWVAYGQAKTANILFTVSLAEKLGPKGLKAYSLHPGGIVTNLGRHMKDYEKDFQDMRTLSRSRSGRRLSLTSVPC